MTEGEGVTTPAGAGVLCELVQHVAIALGIRYAFVGSLLADSRVRPLAFWNGDGYLEAREYSLDGTPCKKVFEDAASLYVQDERGLFPSDQYLATFDVVSYLAVPLKDSNGTVIGHLVAMDVKPMNPTKDEMLVFQLFGEKASAEISRQRMEATLKKRESMLRAVAAEMEIEVGFESLPSLVKNLAAALDVKYAFIAEFCADQTQFRTLAFWAGDHYEDNCCDAVVYAPCESLLAGQVLHCVDGMTSQFQLGKSTLHNLAVRSCLATPIMNSDAHVVGHLVALDVRPMPLDAFEISVFKVFAARAGADLEQKYIQATLQHNEERMRDLFDEAPIAYVYEGLNSKFLRANRAAMNSLGITEAQVESLYGSDFVPEAPDAQRRLKEAMASIGRGTDTRGVILELRRYDNGKPLWVQWWSRPDPSGTYTRTMFLDITDRMLLEQEKGLLEAQNRYLQDEIKLSYNFEEMIGSSSSLKKVLRDVERVAPTTSTVLITGETGTGKELIARAIHDLSPRKDMALVKVNCAAIPSGLIESELFGHEKGAFTGALTKRIGRFELADKGTIFLDEIGELPLDLQSKLLRVLQEGAFERVGGALTIKVNVRVIAATNRDLAQLTKSGQYRPDLFYRLNVFPILVPPLRERMGDLSQLVEYFVQKYAAAQGKSIGQIPERLLSALQGYPWPGNIRELQHVVERAVILADGGELPVVDWLTAPGETPVDHQMPTLEQLERAHIVRALDQAKWRVSGDAGAAAILGLKPTTLEARIKKLGIQRSPLR
jgi:PAS domain S-box-containing protein